MLRRTLYAALVAVLVSVPDGASAQELIPADSVILSIGEHVPRHDVDKRDVRSVPVVAVRTAQSFMCLLPLVLRVDGSATRARLVIRGVDASGPCPSAVGPATGAVELLLAPGLDTLEITASGRSDQYLFHVTTTSLAVETVRSSFTRFDASVFQRAPANSMAFYCVVPRTNTGPDPRQLHICAEFSHWLTDSLGAREFAFEGVGEIAFPVRSDLTRADVRYFYYNRPEDFSLAYDLLQRFSRGVMAKATPHAFIELQNWRGSLISSYRCEAWQGCESIPARPRY